MASIAPFGERDRHVIRQLLDDGSEKHTLYVLRMDDTVLERVTHKRTDGTSGGGGFRVYERDVTPRAFKARMASIEKDTPGFIRPPKDEVPPDWQRVMLLAILAAAGQRP